ncbi:hypothetical protein Tco_1094521 [Tanacetum coccineum]|uniref:Uncharacterized protein n=1 Tax=Tanacetum coccineum TaxID=301880 RepID=A0ABQ5IFR0_9ASTR
MTLLHNRMKKTWQGSSAIYVKGWDISILNAQAKTKDKDGLNIISKNKARKILIVHQVTISPSSFEPAEDGSTKRTTLTSSLRSYGGDCFSSFYQLKGWFLTLDAELQGSHTMPNYYVEKGLSASSLYDSRMRGIFQIIYVIIASTGKLMHLEWNRLCTSSRWKVNDSRTMKVSSTSCRHCFCPNSGSRMALLLWTTTSMIKPSSILFKLLVRCLS